MQFDRDQLDEMCKKVDLLDYASQQFDFKRSGSDNYVTHCPLHVDKTPSLSITPSKNMFYCFSCHKGGGIINWMMTYEHLSYYQAVQKLCKITGTELVERKRSSSFGFFKNCVKIRAEEEEKPVERKYFDADYLEKFERQDGEPHEWIEEGILPEVMDKFGVRIDKAANRIVYPVYDNEDRLIGVKGRTRFKNYKLLGIAKYQNYEKIGTTDYFQGMHENRESILSSKTMIIVEGIKSVFKLYGWGYTNCVSAETSHLNDAQIAIIIRMGIKNVIIAFDSDVPADKIYDNVAKLKPFCNVYYIQDPDVSPDEKASPCDRGKARWDELYKEKKRLCLR